MEKLEKNKQIVLALLEETAALFPKDSYFKVMKIVDKESGQFLIYTDGWDKTWRDYGCFFHIQVKPNGTVYLHHDGTDLELAESLIKKAFQKMRLF
jgi:kynurenine formamidase